MTTPAPSAQTPLASHLDEHPERTDATTAPVESDALLEDVSIDGMCGVY
ncbi:mycofactocin precursor MftA [Leucobacter chromiireducens]|uniref:Mycofactocin n=1 Tax=Leucobacter chromiireducens subsp. solipictus TaxID=398235 RepID=A0ABS1SIH1_9MICO|nr:mycofactocin precursor MftA [Leucobacter chromiireducens]MBL3680270.1 mycofactocin precursor [Leucobacter chromiireducens subsp. solipictus]